MKTRSIQLGTLKEGLAESLPPVPTTASLREWFAGLALANPVLMKDVPVNDRVKEAVRIADELSLALVAPKAFDVDSCSPPTLIELATWERKIAIDNEKFVRQSLDTMPASPSSNHSRQAILPPSNKRETR